MVASIIIAFFIGVLVGGRCASYIVKIMKRDGYVKFEVTKKFMDEMK